jgi:hypothetical protein
MIRWRGGGGGGGGVRIRIWQVDVTTWLFFKMLCIVPQNFSFLFFLLHTRTFFCFCVLLLLRTVCVRVPFLPQPTNAYLIATILTDMEQVVMIEFLTVTIKT